MRLIMEDPGRETRIIEVKGRQIVVRQLTDAQYLLMAREAKRASRNDLDGVVRLTSAARIMDIMETAVVQEEDREYLMDLTVAGDLEISDLMPVITVFGSDKPKARVRRGRAAQHA